MQLEEAIQVAKFRNESHKALINLYLTNSVINGQFKHILTPFGITPQQFNILRIVNGQHPKPVQIGMIKDRLVDRNADITRLVRRLEDKQFLHRQSGAEDKRCQYLTITPHGIALLHAVEQEVITFEDNSTKLSQAELVQLNTLLDKLRSIYLP